MTRQIKEEKIQLNNGIILKIGTMQRKNPKSIYLILNFWLMPTFADDYTTIITECLNNLKKSFIVFLNENNFNKKYIFDYDINFQTIIENTPNYMKIEIVFVQTKFNTLLEFKNEYSNQILNLFNTFLSSLNENDFIIEQKKKNL